MNAEGRGDPGEERDMAQALERSDAYEKYPDHTITLARHEGRVSVAAGGETIADTTRAIRVDETGHDPVYYIPRDDARMDRLESTDHHTHCPFKGDASYFSIRTGAGDGSGRIENAVWTYELPFSQVAEIQNYLAFYPDKTDISVEEK